MNGEVLLGNCAICGGPIFAYDYLSAACRSTCTHGTQCVNYTEEARRAWSEDIRAPAVR